MTKDAPRSFNQHIFFDAKGVYYGTDDGYQDDSMAEFVAFERLYESVGAERRKEIHFVGAVGGLYSLNLMTCWRPTRITFFDINPHAIAYFDVIRRVFAISGSKQEFLERLTTSDFEVDGEAERMIRENLALKQRGQLGRDRGSSYKRSIELSWKYSLDHFELTKTLLTRVPLETRVESIDGDAFAELLREGHDIWLFCSNIAEFTRSQLRFDHPGNAVVTAVIYPGQVDILDLAPFGDRPVMVDCAIPMQAAAIDEVLIPPDPPGDDGALGRALAQRCKDAGLRPNARILDMGCGWGRLALGLLDYLDGRDGAGEYEGLDCHRENLRWAKQEITANNPRFTFHIANFENPYYNPQGTLRADEFRFPYADRSFDMVVMHGLSAYLRPQELEHYLAEAARVLGVGGKLLLSAYVLDEGSASRPHEFRFASGGVAGTRPHRKGRLAYRGDYLRGLLHGAGFELETQHPGAWRGVEDQLVEDLIVAVARGS
jgi:SAM-dependent methyltransferase